MATLLLSAAGSAVGGATGSGSDSGLGLTGEVLGRAIGATLGRVIDEKILGLGSDPVERGHINRFRITGAGEGAPIAELYGRMRLGGHVIWSTQFLERSSTSGGGKGGPSKPKTTTYSYSVSLAVALCKGEIRRIGRIWADGVELDRSRLNYRVYPGSPDQLPDPLIEAIEGAGTVPAYRDLAYVVFEDLDLSPFSNRVPQFAFEVVRMAPEVADEVPAAADLVRAVALMPGTGEYVLATQPVTYRNGFGRIGSANVSAEGGGTDFVQSLSQLRESLPNVQSVSLIYSWFGDDLRAGSCSVQPKVEDVSRDGAEMPWRAGGISRSAAGEIAKVDGRSVYGGTPADTSVIQAIQAIQPEGQAVLFYPFLLMEILDGNALPDPWSGLPGQPALPWRGRITGDLGPELAGTPDGTAANRAAVDAFFGTVSASDFTVSNGKVTYSGPSEWSYTRFILHGAALCAAAGGVEAFCVGSEMRSLTQMRDDLGFPAVDRFRALAAEVRALLPNAKLSYAADWSEYFGYHPQDGSGDTYFHLDPLWADTQIDFVAIDNYMPLSDWRDGSEHADAYWSSIHNLEYLKSNIEGGEGYHWYYPTPEARADQRRDLITDGAVGWAPANPVSTASPGALSGFANSATDRAETAVFSAQVRFPTVPNDAMLWEAGGSGHGAWLGVRDGGSVMRLRAGGGEAVSGSTDTIPVVDVPTTTLPFDGHLHEVMWELQPAAPGRVRLWIDGALVGEAFTDGGGEMQGGTWSGSNPGGWLISGSSVVDGEPIATWPIPADASDLTFSKSVFPIASPETSYVFRYKDLRGWWQNEHRERRNGALLANPTEWVPQSKPIWFTEIGCAAIDKGTNQPNKFLDEKSSESALPHYSNGRRDDLLQAQYIRAIMSYWQTPENNPVSSVYGGPMLDMAQAHVWAWDARPWPAFPNDGDLWTDGDNWARGHWLTGRSDLVPLDQVVADLCRTSGLESFDVSQLHGVVRGYMVGETETVRARLQSLMMAYGFQAVERDGCLVFLPQAQGPELTITEDITALDDRGSGGVHETRAAQSELTGRVRMAFTSAEDLYQENMAEAVFPGEASDLINASQLPVALTASEGQAVAERWLAEARVARDEIRFSLPPSQRTIAAGMLVETPDQAVWRIDRIEDRGVRAVEAVRVEPTVFNPSDAVEERVTASNFVPPLPVTSVFMDLPLMSGDEDPHVPHLAVAARPWPGSVALYSSSSQDGYALNTLLERGAVMGVLETELPAAKPGLWDRAGTLRIQTVGGTLSSAAETAVLNGANIAAIGSGDDGLWEVIQFADATLVGDGLWEIGMRLRGQQGTDAVMPEIWPEGSLFVLLDGAPQQIELPASARGLARYYRVGPAGRGVDDSTFEEHQLAFDGVGLRPFSPVHLKAERAGSAQNFHWIRRSRIDADSWEGGDVPLGEASEAYVLRISDISGLKRETTVDVPEFSYTDAMRGADGTVSPYSIEVAQVSDRFGPGPFARIEIND